MLGSCAGIAVIISGVLGIVYNDQIAVAIQHRQALASIAETRALVDPEQKAKGDQVLSLSLSLSLSLF